ncbi:cuticle protein AM/CP1114-like [Penaeus indicus]|uniref:cuticle protein AM/CP1114-like n=1 Tax=Penaeus indicus TaxID=29960 RepID=UPI00300CAA73
MIFTILALVVAVAAAVPQKDRPIAILRDDRIAPESGSYSFQFETENGIRHTEDGSPGEKGQTNSQGVYSYLLDDGSVVEVTYVANENGFQAQSPLLPVAPAFPHPIPEYVLRQIEFAQQQESL